MRNPTFDDQAIFEYNQIAWDTQVRLGNQWTIPASSEQISRARDGEIEIVLTPTRRVPAEWLCNVKGCRVLCLASGGGQQGPVLAAAGASVTVFDASKGQLSRDQEVAQREGLTIRTIQGDMRDLTHFSSGEFDLIVHPCSNTFVPDIRPVWKEAARVLRSGGELLSGFCNPVLFIFDYDAMKKGELRVRHHIPYSDLAQLPSTEIEKLRERGEPLCFGHTLEDQVGGQTAAGFSINGFYEDTWTDDAAFKVLSSTIATFAATRSRI